MAPIAAIATTLLLSSDLALAASNSPDIDLPRSLASHEVSEVASGLKQYWLGSNGLSAYVKRLPHRQWEWSLLSRKVVKAHDISSDAIEKYSKSGQGQPVDQSSQMTSDLENFITAFLAKHPKLTDGKDKELKKQHRKLVSLDEQIRQMPAYHGMKTQFSHVLKKQHMESWLVDPLAMKIAREIVRSWYAHPKQLEDLLAQNKPERKIKGSKFWQSKTKKGTTEVSNTGEGRTGDSNTGDKTAADNAIADGQTGDSTTGDKKVSAFTRLRNRLNRPGKKDATTTDTTEQGTSGTQEQTLTSQDQSGDAAQFPSSNRQKSSPLDDLPEGRMRDDLTNL